LTQSHSITPVATEPATEKKSGLSFELLATDGQARRGRM